MRRVMVAMACAVLMVSAGCGDSDVARDAHRASRAIVDKLRGAPDAGALAATARFDGGGVSFDYPTVLAATHERDEGDDTWAFAYGLFELELYAAGYGITAREYLEELGNHAAGSTDMTLITPARPGRAAVICGVQATSTLLDITILGDAQHYESFDLPPDARGRARVLTLSEDRATPAPSSVLSATERMVLGSLRCDTAAVPETAGG